jgi:hypothetical protein
MLILKGENAGFDDTPDENQDQQGQIEQNQNQQYL